MTEAWIPEVAVTEPGPEVVVAETVVPEVAESGKGTGQGDCQWWVAC